MDSVREFLAIDLSTDARLAGDDGERVRLRGLALVIGPQLVLGQQQWGHAEHRGRTSSLLHKRATGHDSRHVRFHLSRTNSGTGEYRRRPTGVLGTDLVSHQ